MKDESNALIRLTKSELEYVIISLTHSLTAAEYFQTEDNYTMKMFNKLKIDFKKIKEDLEEIESNEIRNTIKTEAITGKQAGPECD